MKSRYFLLLLLLAISFAACGDSASSDPELAAQEELFAESMKGVEEIKLHEQIDPENGLVQTRYPIPKTWEVHSPEDAIFIEGPDQLKVFKSEFNQYGWSNSPMMRETIQMTGNTVAQPLSNEQILKQYILPDAQQQGYTFLTSYPVPEVAGFYQRFFLAMANTGSQRQVEALGTEWDAPNGSKSFILLVRTQSTQQQAMVWTLQTSELECAPDAFEEARSAYIYSIGNAQINPEWIQKKNGQLLGDIQKSQQFWANASAQSAAAHRQRMSAIAARGNAATSIGNTYSDILDISHQGYLNRSSINDAGHSATIRSINETTIIGNHETGEHYNVPSGSNYYWVSSDGTWIGTDNALLNPNTDNRLNDLDWTKFAQE